MIESKKNAMTKYELLHVSRIIYLYFNCTILKIVNADYLFEFVIAIMQWYAHVICWRGLSGKYLR